MRGLARGASCRREPIWERHDKVLPCVRTTKQIKESSLPSEKPAKVSDELARYRVQTLFIMLAGGIVLVLICVWFYCHAAWKHTVDPSSRMAREIQAMDEMIQQGFGPTSNPDLMPADDQAIIEDLLKGADAPRSERHDISDEELIDLLMKDTHNSPPACPGQGCHKR